MVEMVKEGKIAKNGQNHKKWSTSSKIVQNGPKLSKMVQNGPK